MDARLKLYLQKYRWYERNRFPWRRAQMHLHAMRGEFFIRPPVQGNVLEALDGGRLAIGKNTLLEPGCWITIADEGKVAIGEGCFLNLGTMIAAQHEVTIGDHVMFANHCFISDASHRFDDPELPVTWQGFISRGPVRIGSNSWLGKGVVVTGGTEIGEHSVIGSNSVVTRDVASHTIAAGVPAKAIRKIEYPEPEPPAVGG